MMATKTITYLKLLVLFLSCTLHAQNGSEPLQKDTLFEWRSKFLDISISNYSPNGRWVAINKWRNLKSDTIILIDTQKPNLPPINIVKMTDISFTSNNHLLTQKVGQAKWWNLDSKTFITYENIMKAALLADNDFHVVLYNNEKLEILNSNGKIQFIENNVHKMITDGRKNLFFIKEENRQSVLYLWNKNARKEIFNTADNIEQIDFSSTGNNLILHLREKTMGKKKIAIINIQNKNISFPFATYLPQTSSFKITEIGDKNDFFIQTQNILNNDQETVELWYGNDGDLQNLQLQQKRTHEYWLWKPLSSHLKQIPSNKYPTIVNIGSSRYFLAFNRAALQNYMRWIPDIELWLYDDTKERYLSLDIIRGELNTSKEADFVIYRNTDEQWKIVNIKTLHASTITSKENLQNPSFSSDSKTIFFESDNGIWEYDIITEKLDLLKATKGFTAQVLNSNVQIFATEYKLYSRWIEYNTPLFLKLFETSSGKTSYGLWENDHYKNVLPPTTNAVHDIRYDAQMQSFIHREENYNLFPIIKKMQLHKKSEMVYKNKIQNMMAKTIYREVIKYKNTEGIPLKGLLYYPKNFDSQKKYPLITHIYQIQSTAENDYVVPGEGAPDGFDLPALLERGYLVYLPDIIFDTNGTGKSALDCVENALNAIMKKPFIDNKRLGLIGHSHGGYETNFIATHSLKFAAYVSGSGNSDIIRSYFSYNYNFSSPFYWQFENGQYEMPGPFSKNKDLYFENNPIYNVEKVSSPILLWAGKKDRNIAWDQVMEFYIGLKRNNKDTIALFYPNHGHDVGINTEEMCDLNRRILDWWDYFLKEKKNIPWIQKQMKKDAN